MTNMKVVDLKKLNNVHVGTFSSCYGKSRVILEFLFWSNSKLEFPPNVNLNFKLFWLNSLGSFQNLNLSLKGVL